jgi:hypothetical protein
MRLVLIAVVFGAGCLSSTSVVEQRMAFAPSREPACALELVSDSVTSPAFNQKWQLLGYVMVRGAAPDPFAPATRDLVRPRACGMGATSVMPVMGVATDNAGTVVYMALRPRSDADVRGTF